MQVLRLMNMPDRVIAFDELPERLLSGLEMCRADGFPRHWKEWVGKKEKITAIPPEKDLLTGAVRRFDPIVEQDYFFYLVDWTIQSNEEKWAEICDYVRQNVNKEFRLMDKIEDMAKPLAGNKSDGVTLEPEEVVIIPLPKENEAPKEIKKPSANESVTVKCDAKDCTFEAQGAYAKNSLRMHKLKKHTAPVAA